MKIKGILWDNDGVLVNTECLFYEANRSLFLEHGIDLTHKNFFDWFLCENYGAWHLLTERGVSDTQIQLYRKERDRRYSDYLHRGDNLEIEHVSTILHSLSNNARMGIVTSSRREHFDIIHKKLNLLTHFEFVVTDEDYVNSKPAPDPYLLGLKHLGLPRDQCLVIEDSPRGLQAAQAAGIRCIVIRNALTTGHHFDGAYRVVDSHAQLLEAIQSIW
jgi:HAD superfamily hydrolase (TIGR01509 family)